MPFRCDIPFTFLQVELTARPVQREASGMQETVRFLQELAKQSFDFK
jgi:hypothetical protein